MNVINTIEENGIHGIQARNKIPRASGRYSTNKEKEPQGVLESFRETCRQEIHLIACSHVAEKEYSMTRRLFWAALVVATVSFVGYILKERIVYYLSDPMAYDLEIIDDHELPSPALTLCLNYKTKYLFKKLKKWPLEREIFKNTLQPKYLGGIDRNKTTITEEEMAGFNWEFFFKILRPRYQPICMFLESLMSGDTQSCGTKFVPDNVNDFELESLRKNCFTLHDHSWSLDDRDGVYYLALQSEVGNIIEDYSLLIHSGDEIGSFHADAKTIPVKRSTKHIFRITRRDLVLAQGTCNTPHSRKLRFFDRYSELKCCKECLVNFTLNSRYNCYFPFGFNLINSEKICHPSQWRELYAQLSREYIESNEHSKCNCLPLCEQQTYEVIVSSGRPRKYNKKLPFIKIFIKYKSTRVERIKQKRSTTFFNLIAEIGGILSLGLGFQLLTCFEFCSALFKSIFKNEQKTKPHQRETEL